MSQATYVIVSLKWTLPRHRYVTFWRPDRCGYAWPLSWAGHYTEAEALSITEQGTSPDEFAVLLSLAMKLGIMPRAGDVDGNKGPVVKRCIANMRVLLAAKLLPAANEGRVAA